MNEPKKLGRRVVVKARRKGRGRRSTGKLAVLYITSDSGEEVELLRARAPNFRAVQKKLRSTNLIPTYVTLKKHGETRF